MEVFIQDKSSSSESATKDRRYRNHDLGGSLSYHFLNFPPKNLGKIRFPVLQTCFNSVAQAPLNITLLRGHESLLEILPPISVANAYITCLEPFLNLSVGFSKFSNMNSKYCRFYLYSLLMYDHGKKKVP